jgi:glutathione reductase (NADPH)
MGHYDVVVIGAGTVGGAVARAVRQAGRSVALVDHRALGGTCALRGCIPKKVLYGVAHAVRTVDNLRQHSGSVAGECAVDWPELTAFRRTFTEPIPAERAKEYAEAGIEVVRGQARFRGPQTLRVDGTDLGGDAIVVATGAVPRRLDFPGAEHLITSDDFFELESLPARVAFVGGGYISFEFAHIAAAAGANVAIFHADTRPLGGFEPVLVDKLVAASRAAKIRVHLDSAVREVRAAASGYEVETAASTETFDVVVHGAGRSAAIAELDLPAGEVDGDEAGVAVTRELRSVSNPAVWAGGDAANAGWPLTPVAGEHGRVIAHNIVSDEPARPDDEGVASVVFTMPPLARVGSLESQARADGIRFRVLQGDASDWFQNRRLGTHHAGYKILVEEDSDRIVGAHLMGEGADEAINLFVLALRHGITRSELAGALYAYPTAGWDIRYMLQAEH